MSAAPGQRIPAATLRRMGHQGLVRSRLRDGDQADAVGVGMSAVRRNRLDAEREESNMRGIVVVDQPVEDRGVCWHVNVGDGLEWTMAGAWGLAMGADRITRLMSGREAVTT